MKLLFLVADGMGDWPVAGLGNRTPLEVAFTPHMDELALCCLAGTIGTIPHGMPAGSDVANMSLLGFDPVLWHTGRAPVEAAAQGLELCPQDLIWRLNLVCVSSPDASGRMQDYTGGHISTEQAVPLLQDMQKHLGSEVFTFVPGVQYRHLLIQKGGVREPEAALSVRAPHDIFGQCIASDRATYSKSPLLAELIAKAARRLERKENSSRANYIWLWGQGSPLTLPDFYTTYGMRGGVISAVDLIRGLGRAAGLEVLKVPGATGLLDTDYAGKVSAAVDFLMRGGDFVYLHVEAPDECAHAGIAADKVEAIARFDARIVGPLRREIPRQGNDIALCITCDHFTPLARRVHTKDPVPFLLVHPRAKEHSLPCFSEKQAQQTGVTVQPGHTIQHWIQEALL